jgi:hypothetical protein
MASLQVSSSVDGVSKPPFFIVISPLFFFSFFWLGFDFQNEFAQRVYRRLAPAVLAPEQVYNII